MYGSVQGPVYGGVQRCTAGVRSVYSGVVHRRCRTVSYIYSLVLSPGLRLVFTRRLQLTLGRWPRVSLQPMRVNNPSATGSDVTEVS